jgi:hypothetical protein
VWAKGEKVHARDLLQRILRFNPEQGSAKRLLEEMH